MKKVETFSNILNDIIELAQKILDLSNIFYENEEKIKRKMTKRGYKNVSTDFEDLVKKYVKDASSIIKEKKAFTNFVLGVDQSQNIKFMKMVWNGDMYGKEGVDGLKMLKQDLEEQVHNLNIDNIFEKL